ARNWMTDMCEVDSNLMRAAGFDLNLQQREVLIAVGDFVNRVSRPARSPLQHRHASPVVRAASNASFDLSALVGEAAIDEGDVQLVHLPLAKLIRQSLMCEIILRNDK